MDVSKIGVSSFEGPDGSFEVDVFDATEDYVKLMKWVTNLFENPSHLQWIRSNKKLTDIQWSDIQ